MATLGDTANRICDELDRDDMTAQAKLQIVSAIRHYHGNKFWFNEERADTVTESGVELYALPDDYVDHLSLRLTVGETTYPLIYRDYSTSEELFSANTTGVPIDYAIWEQQIRLMPTPNDDYTLTISYTRKFPELSDDDDSNEWLRDEAEEMIRSRAEAQICFRILQDANRGGIYSNLEQAAFLRVLRRANHALSTKRTKTWGFK